MKNFMKKAAVCIFAFGLLFFESACDGLFNMQIPETVSVKTSAEYNVPLGEASFDLSSLLSSEELLNNMRTSMGGEVDLYEYITNEDVLTYVLHKSMYEIPFDMGSYLGNLDLASALGGADGISLDQTIELPSVNLSTSKELDLSDVLDALTEKIGSAGASFTLSNVAEPAEFGPVEASAFFVSSGGSPNVEITTGLYDAIKYAAGSKLVIAVTRKDSNELGSDFSFTLEASIPDYSSVVSGGFTGASGSTQIKNGGTIELDISGGYIPSTLNVNFDGEASGGDSGKFHEYEISVSLSSGTKIATIYGIHPDNGTSDTSDDIQSEFEFEIPSMNVPLGGMGDIVSSLTIANDGESVVTIDASSIDGWTGITADISEFSVTGAGLNLTKSDLDVGGNTGLLSKKLDFGGKTLTPNGSDLSVSGKTKVTIEDGAVINFGANGNSNQSVTVSIVGGISKLASVNIDFTKIGGIPTESNPMELSEEIPAELKKYVTGLDFGYESDGKYYKRNTEGDPTSEESEGFGLRAKYVNTLPAGNNLAISVQSTLFSLDDELTIAGGTSSKTKTECLEHPTVDFSSASKIDFKVSLPNTQILTNLEMGKSYTISLSDVEFVCDWDRISVNLSSMDAIDLDLDLSSLDIQQMLSSADLPDFVKDFVNSIEFEELPVYFYAQKPDDNSALKKVVEGLNINGTVALSYDDKDSNPHNEDLLNNGSLNFVDPVAWPSGDVTKIKSSDPIASVLNTDSASFNKDLADIINHKPSNLKVTGNISFAGGSSQDVYASTIAELSSSEPAKIALDVAVVLPLKLKQTKPVIFEPMKLAYDDWETNNMDLLMRENASTYEEYAQYADLIKYVRITSKSMNNVIPNIEISADIQDAESGINKTFAIGSGTSTLDFTGEEIRKVMTSYPFHPDIEVTVGRPLTDEEELTGTGLYASPIMLSVSRKAFNSDQKALGADVTLSVTMNGDSSITVWGGKEQ